HHALPIKKKKKTRGTPSSSSPHLTSGKEIGRTRAENEATMTTTTRAHLREELSPARTGTRTTAPQQHNIIEGTGLSTVCTRISYEYNCCFQLPCPGITRDQVRIII